MAWSKSTLILAAVAATLFITTITGAYLTFRRTQDLAGARHVAAAAVKTADEAISYADSVDKAAQAHVAHVDTIVKYRTAKAPERARIIAASPDTCGPAIAALTAELQEADSTAHEWKAAYEDQKRATAKLKPATQALATATTELVKASKPSFFARLIPHVGVGATAGVSALDRRPDVVIGITIGYDF